MKHEEIMQALKLGKTVRADNGRGHLICINPVHKTLLCYKINRGGVSGVNNEIARGCQIVTSAN